MLILGSHVGFKKDEQLLGSLKEALSYGANTFMFYTGAPHNTMRYPINEEKRDEALLMMREHDIDYSKVVVHAPYIINLANDDEIKFNFSVQFLKEEIARCNILGIKKMVLHPGSHVGLGIERGIESIIRGLNLILDGKYDVTILLETMAGKGSEVGSRLEEIKTIIDGVNDKEHIGVCIDTCHLSDAGYDLRDFDKFLEVDKIGCVHVNDSKNVFGLHKDRHENIGFGEVGFDTLMNVIYNKRLEEVPKILETPYVDREYPPYKYEIEMIKNRKFDLDLIKKIKGE